MWLVEENTNHGVLFFAEHLPWRRHATGHLFFYGHEPRRRPGITFDRVGLRKETPVSYLALEPDSGKKKAIADSGNC
jgi:hypothetical protein